MQQIRSSSLMLYKKVAEPYVHRSGVTARSMSQDVTKHVAVVGAGYAGLAAARTLLASPRVKVTLYEATDRVGGRAATGLLPISKSPVELGATWFHGTQQNPVYDLAVEYGIVPASNKVTAAVTTAAAGKEQLHDSVEAVNVNPLESAAAAGVVEHVPDLATAAAAAPAAPILSTADATANAAGGSSSSGADQDPRWELLLCAPNAAAPLQGQQKDMALEAFQQYSAVLGDVLDEAVLQPASSAAAAASAVSQAAVVAAQGAGLKDPQQQQQSAAVIAGLSQSSLGSLLRERFDAITSTAAAADGDDLQQQQQLGGEAGRQLSTDLAGLDDLKQAFVDGWACRERLQRAYDGFSSTDAAGVAHALEYVDLDGPNMPVPGGYQNLAELLAADAVRSGLKLLLTTPICRIHWNRADGKVAVEVADGSNAVHVYDAVVFTCSLGVLKRQAADLFVPELPAEKVTAIQQLQIGQVEKLFVEWPAAAPKQQAPVAFSSVPDHGMAQQQQQQQQQRKPGATVLVGTGSNLVGPRKPKTQMQMHDYQVQCPTGNNAAAATNSAAAANSEDVGLDNSSSSSAAFTTYCLLWPSRAEFWSTAWQQQQQHSGCTGCSNACPDPIYVNCLSSNPQQQQQQLPQWLLGLHSWRYGDGPEWIKAAAGSSSKSQQQQQQQQQYNAPERSAVVWVTGQAAQQLGDLTDAFVLEHLGQLLQLFPAIPQPDITLHRLGKPDAAAAGSSEDLQHVTPEFCNAQSVDPLSHCKLLRSTWCQSSHYQGSYSYPGPQATGETADVLAAPLTTAAAAAGSGAGDALVCFAGEATSRHHMGTVHGAYMSGVREAERLLRQWGLV